MLLLGSAAAGAQQALPTEIRAGAGHSDNITRNLDSAAISASWGEAGLTTALNEKTPYLEGALAADVTYRKYSQHDFGSEVIGGANGHLAWKLYEDLVKLVVEDVYGQSLIDSFAPNTPQNRMGTNYVAVGPDVAVPLGERTQAYASGRWGRATYDALLIDNERRSVTVGLRRKVTPMTTLRVEVSGSRITFDQPEVNPALDTRQYTVGAHRDTTRSTIDLEVGRTKIKTNGRDDSELLAHATALYHLTPNSTVTFAAGHEYSDSAEFLRLQAADMGPVGPIGPGIVGSDPLRSTYADVGWAHDSGRLMLRLTADWRHDRRQVETALDVNRLGVGTDLTYQFSGRLTGGVHLLYGRDQFVETSTQRHEVDAGINVGWALTSKVFARALYEHVHGIDIIGGATYNENRITVLFGYRPRR